ncbi:MAG: hypothetical protein DRQ89_13370 [Epsilonproteobacteria bacterium]|nr:MAG: hypothetical protein DRQ89_13370 [Campylobacterota bacterium]
MGLTIEEKTALKKYILLPIITLLILTLNACNGDSGTSKPKSEPAADATIVLGSQERVRLLFSYPNSCGPVVCFQNETVAETVKRWFDYSIRRDGFQATSEVRKDSGEFFLDITLKDSQQKTGLPAFVRRYEEFLRHGDTAVELARTYNKEKNKWLPNWRFLLPHGLPLTNNRTLEVMNFPPVSLVLKTQDYLDSATTHRWNKMFIANGVKEENLDLYGAIVDIVPVAAPANEGYILRDTQHIYSGHFNPYAMAMVEMWTRIEDDPEHSKPIMTLGREMLTWFNVNYHAELKNVLDVTEISMTDKRKVPIMFTNHPSKIFYSTSFKAALKIMDQDAVANCWQAEMGKSPETNPQEMKTRCTERWQEQVPKKCEMVWVQDCGLKQDKAVQLCADHAQRSGDDESRDWCGRPKRT